MPKKCKKHRVAYRCNRQNRRARHNVTSNPTSGHNFHIGNKFYANPVEINNSNVFILQKKKSTKQHYFLFFSFKMN